MITEQEIRERLDEVRSDDRMKAKSASVFANAPLALIQTEGEATVAALLWVLGERKRCAGSYPSKAALDAR